MGAVERNGIHFSEGQTHGIIEYFGLGAIRIESNSLLLAGLPRTALYDEECHADAP